MKKIPSGLSFGPYGKSGENDNKVIDTYLAQLRKGAVVVNLGCGPNVKHELHNLARMVGYYQFRSTLILADRATDAIQNQAFVPGPEKVKVVELNAASATSVLGKGRTDLILALGLFGDLGSSTTTAGTGKAALPAVLCECLNLLKPSRHLIVSNSCDRQPFEEFKAAVEQAGFNVTYHHVSVAAWGQEKPGNQRYLIVCQKPKRSRRAVKQQN